MSSINRISQRYILPGSIKRNQQLAEERSFAVVVSKSGSVGDVSDIHKAIKIVRKIGGGRILVKPGTYKLLSQLVLDSNISLFGEDPYLTILDFRSATIPNNGCIDIPGSLITSIGSFAITKNTATVTGTSTDFTTKGATSGDVLLINSIPFEIASVASDTALTLVDKYRGATLSGKAVRILRTKINIEIANLTIKSAADFYGILASATQNITISNIITDGCQSGVNIDYSFNVDIHKSTFKNSDSSGVTLQNIFGGNIYNNYCINNLDNGLISSAGGEQPLFITDNTFNGNGLHGVHLFVATYNVVTGNMANSNAGSGIVLQGATGNVVSNNTVLRNAVDGIRLLVQISQDSGSNTVMGNIVENNVDNGIILTSGGNNNIVCHNFNNNNADNMDNGGTGNIVFDNWVDS